VSAHENRNQTFHRAHNYECNLLLTLTNIRTYWVSFVFQCVSKLRCIECIYGYGGCAYIVLYTLKPEYLNYTTHPLVALLSSQYNRLCMLRTCRQCWGSYMIEAIIGDIRDNEQKRISPKFGTLTSTTYK